MNRRTVLKYCLVYTAGATFLPSCLQQKSKSGILLKNIKISGQQEEMIASLTESFIPTTNTPGAREVSAHLFALMMIDECYKPEEQETFLLGMKQFEELNHNKFNKTFSNLSTPQKQEILTDMEAMKKEKDNPLASFYSNLRNLTIQAFTGSKYYLTQVHVYEMVPGRFHGCVPLKTAKA